MPAYDILQIIVVNMRGSLCVSRVFMIKPFADAIKTGSAVIEP